MWMVYISLEEKHKAETLGTPVSANGAERLNMRKKERKFHETFNPNWREANQLAIYNGHLLYSAKQLQLKIRTGIKPVWSGSCS